MKRRFGIVLGILLALLTSAQAQTDYTKGIEKWRSEREANLKKETGWLTVAGLFWLKEGINTVGAGEKFDVRLMDNFKQEKFGEIEFKNGAAILKLAKGIEALVDGKRFTGAVNLVSDEKGKPTEIRTGTQTFFLIKREERFGIRLKDSNSEARRNFKGLHWFPVDESYKVKARLEAWPEPKELSVPNVLGGNFKMKSPGVLKFSLNGKECSLQPVDEGDRNAFHHLRRSVEPERHLQVGTIPLRRETGERRGDSRFNKAENPPCAFTPYATCPLPPAGNSLEIEIKAGEKRYDH